MCALRLSNHQILASKGDQKSAVNCIISSCRDELQYILKSKRNNNPKQNNTLYKLFRQMSQFFISSKNYST